MGCSVSVANTEFHTIPCHFCADQPDGEFCWPTCDGTMQVPDHREMSISYSTLMRMIKLMGLNRWQSQYDNIAENAFCTFEVSDLEDLERDLRIAITVASLQVMMAGYDTTAVGFLNQNQALVTFLRGFHEVVLHAQFKGESISWA
tara:strand:- start:3303 stop:3740 length:438 start_codon:yes stop_codon:yes gene_type:complete